MPTEGLPSAWGSTYLHSLTYSTVQPFADYDQLLEDVGLPTDPKTAHSVSVKDVSPSGREKLRTIDDVELTRLLLTQSTISHEQNHVRQVTSMPFVLMLVLNRASDLSEGLARLRRFATEG